MNLRNLILSGVVAAFGLVAVGCNENPIADPGTTTTGGPKAVTELQASSMSETSVGLKWTQPTDTVTGAISYMVSWASSGLATIDSGSVTTAGGATSATATGLKAGTAYTFYVKGIRGTTTSGVTSITWAGAARSTTINAYEFKSVNPSGISLSASGGPVAVSMKAGAPGIAQLAILLTPGTTGGTPTLVEIGAAFAFTEYKAVAQSDPNKVDQTVFLSAATKNYGGLDSWYETQSLDQLIAVTNTDGSPANANAFPLSGAAIGNSQGFYVRYGAVGAYHYARVFMKAVNGSVVQGTYPNRYVTLEISYQTAANLPYAKRVAPKVIAIARPSSN